MTQHDDLTSAHRALPRLIYLAAEFKPLIPSKELLTLVPQGDLIREAAKYGIAGLGPQLGVSAEQGATIVQAGREAGVGSIDEFKLTVASLISNSLELKRDDYRLDAYLALQSQLHQYLSGNDDTLVANEEASLDTLGDHWGDIPKFNSGVTPLDDLLGGWYQGLFTVLAKPGTGKTSFMLSLMESLRANSVFDELWFYEMEIPKNLMLYRMQPMVGRVKFKSTDKLRCGLVTSQQILRDVIDNPNPSRAIFIDGPDVMSGSAGDKKRFAIESIYRDCIAVKERSGLVIVSSQVKQTTGRISLESGAEAWNKSWYSDAMIGLQRLGSSGSSLTQIRAVCPKNRFGISDREVNFLYDYGELAWRPGKGGVTQANSEGEDEWDD